MRSPSFSRSSSSQTMTICPRGCPRSRPRSAANGRCLSLIAALTASFSTYLASTSTSRFTVAPGSAAPRVVRSSVSGISETANASSSTRGDGQRHAVDRDRALLDDVAQQLGRRRRCVTTRAKPSSRTPVDRRRRRRRGPARCGRRGGRAARSGSSRFTRAALAQRRRARSGAASRASRRRAKASSSTAVAVRQTPLTATESPSASSPASAVPTPQAHAVAVSLDRGDGAEVCDQPGEHRSPLPQARGDQHVVGDALAVERQRAHGVGDRSTPSPSSGSRAVRAAQHERREEQADLVDLAGVEEGAGQVRAALEQDRGDAAARRAGRARSARARARSRRWRRSRRRRRPRARPWRGAGAARETTTVSGTSARRGTSWESSGRRALGVEHDAARLAVRRPRRGR